MHLYGTGQEGVTLPAQRTMFQSFGCKMVCGWELLKQPQPSVLEKKPLNQSGSSGSPTLTQMASDWAMHTQGRGGRLGESGRYGEEPAWMAQRHPLPRSGSLAMPFGTLFLP